MSRRIEDLTDAELRRLLRWHMKRCVSIGDLKRAQEAQDESSNYAWKPGPQQWRSFYLQVRAYNYALPGEEQ